MTQPRTIMPPDKPGRTCRRVVLVLSISVATFALSGCATAVVGSITLGQISTAAGIASVSTTGKGLQDHALSAVTGRDCRLLEGFFRANRHICEDPGSPATDEDFPGVVVMLLGPRDEDENVGGEPEVLYAGRASDYRPSLARAQRHRPVAQDHLVAPDALVEVPSVREWARTRPAPTITAARYTSISNSSAY